MSPTKNQVAPDDAVPLPGSTDGQNGNGTENNGIAHVTEPGQLPVCRIAVQRHDTDTATPVNGKEQEVSLVSTAHGGLQGQLNSMEEVEAANKAPLEEPLLCCQENGAGQHAPVKSIALRPDFQRVKARAGDDDAEARCFIGPEWFVFHPYSTPRLAWDMWVVILLIYTALMVPFALAFQAAVCGVHADTGSVILQWFVDSCFWFDILLNFRTAILDPNADNLTQMQ
eukprot:2801551-Rhodomonas_salina.1